jgi:hypothetical protein
MRLCVHLRKKTADFENSGLNKGGLCVFKTMERVLWLSNDVLQVAQLSINSMVQFHTSN